MKKYAAFLIILIVFNGCSRIPSDYPFPNQSEPILSIELLHNRNDGGQGTNAENMYLIRALSESEIHEFMKAVYALPTEKCGSPPPWGYGEYIARISYQNGDVEMYGPYAIELIPKGSETWGVGTHCFSGNGFEKLFSQYVDLSELPDPPPYK